MEEMRSLKLKEVVEELTSRIDNYKLLTKSLQEDTSTLNHAVYFIKNFMQTFKPSDAVNSLDKLNYDIGTLTDNMSDLSRCVTKLDKLEGFIIERSHFDRPNAESSSDKLINDRLNNLESLCKQLNCKIDTLNSMSTPTHNNINTLADNIPRPVS